MPILSIRANPASAGFTLDADSTLFKTRKKLKASPQTQRFRLNLPTMERERNASALSITLKSQAAKSKIRRRLRFLALPASAPIRIELSMLLNLNPPPRPKGKIVYNDQPFGGQRLRGGDFHQATIILTGERLTEFELIFRAKSLGVPKPTLIERRTDAGIVNPVIGVDPETGETQITYKLFLYGSDTFVSKETEYRYELEVDDHLGVRYGLEANQSFFVYPDKEP